MWNTLFSNPLGARRIGTFGDVNPIDYGGGVIYRTKYGIQIEYTPGFDQYPVPKKVEVFQVDLPEDVFEEHDWAKPGAVAGFTGDHPNQLKDSGRGTIQQRVYTLEAIAGYYGWHELDTDPLVLTEKELRARWRM